MTPVRDVCQYAGFCVCKETAWGCFLDWVRPDAGAASSL